jgi:uncharacterized membrane protein YciS (DUF1049 family)
MGGFGKKSTAYICYLIVNAWWYLSCLVGILFPALLTYGYLQHPGPDAIMGINVPLADSMVALKNPGQYQHITIDSVSGQVDFSYLLQNNPTMYILWGLFFCVVLALFIFGIYQLRNLLKASVNNAIFTRQNVSRIKIIAVIIMLVDPLRWIQHHFMFKTLSNIIPPETADIHIGLPMVGNDWTFIVMGLLVFTLAAVFEKGHEMYQELKLTV